MKKILMMALILTLSLAMALPAAAETASVTFDGDADQFIFAPGSQYSPTDLFPNFKNVMPGDQLYQQITVRNDPSHNCKVKIYMRSLGAHPDSVECLSKLGLTVQKSDDNTMAYMFDAMADETAQLTDWVCLGTLYSGGEVNLDVTLNVPTSLDNEFQSEIGYLDWEFMLEEFPIESDDPKPPDTGDNSSIDLWLTLIICAVALLIILIIWRKKNTENEKDNVQQ